MLHSFLTRQQLTAFARQNMALVLLGRYVFATVPSTDMLVFISESTKIILFLKSPGIVLCKKMKLYTMGQTFNPPTTEQFRFLDEYFFFRSSIRQGLTAAQREIIR